MDIFSANNISMTPTIDDNMVRQLNRYTLLIILLFGNIGTCFNLLIYIRPIYISASCTVYLIASTINTFIVLDFVLLTRLLEAGFQFQTSAYSLIYCKIRTYIYFTTMTFGMYCIVLASIDRFLSTMIFSIKCKYIQNQSYARIITVILAFCCLAAYAHILQYFGIDPVHHRCCPCLRTIYVSFFAWFFGIVYCLIPILLMSIFSILTVRNLHRIRQISLDNICRHRSQQFHLIRLILLSVISTLLLTLPFTIKHFYMASINSRFIGFSKKETLIMNTLRLPFYINHAIPFYMNLMISRGFRKEFLKLIRQY